LFVSIKPPEIPCGRAGKAAGKESEMTFDKIKDIIAEQLQVETETITLETSLMKDLEADSLDAVEIIMGIENEFGIEIPDEEAEKFQSIGDIVKYVEANAK
jgi:acyl carrier protein